MKPIRLRPSTITSLAIPAVLVLGLTGAAPALADTLAQIRQRGEIRLGYHPDARPFSYRDESGKVEG
jgi:ABC-type amino acid transport substrate-binding protein